MTSLIFIATCPTCESEMMVTRKLERGVERDDIAHNKEPMSFESPCLFCDTGVTFSELG